MDEKNQILNSVIEITAQRDSELLEQTLIKTIYELFQADESLFIKTARDNKTKKLVFRYRDQQLDKLDTTGSIQQACSYYNELLEKAEQSNNFLTESDNVYLASVYPVIYRRELFGFIAFRTAFNKVDDSHLMEGFLKIYQNYLNLLIDNQLDKLTSLLNRKTFDDKILQVIHLLQNSDQNRRDIWLGVFDLDNFKSINDKYGHIYGDDVLILFARLMRKSFREDDILFRFGGEEFVVVLQAGSSQEAFVVINNFIKAVETFDFGLAGKLTVSAGMVRMGADDELPTIVGHADQALYYAKKNGKNQVCVYEELVDKGAINSQISHGDIVFF